jgi:hypothetical protein
MFAFLCALTSGPGYKPVFAAEAEDQKPAEIIGAEDEKDERPQAAGAGEKIPLPGLDWRQIAGPQVNLRCEAAGSFFRTLEAGLYVFEMQRADGKTVQRKILVPPGPTPDCGARRPCAELLAKNLSGQTNQPLLLDASLSRHPDGPEAAKNLAACWSTPDKERGVKLEPLPGLRCNFTARRPGIYSVTLVISDGQLDSEPPETAFINIAEIGAPDPANDPSNSSSPLSEKDPRYRSIKIGLWESSLSDAVWRFASHSGLTLRVDADVAPPGAWNGIPLHLEVNDAPLLHLLDWVARQAHCVYRRESAGSFWLTTPLGWLKQEKLEPLVEPVDALYEKKDASDLLASLGPCFQALEDARSGLSLEFEAERQVLVGVLTQSSAVRLREICRCLRATAEEELPPPETDAEAEAALRRTLAEKTVTLRARGRQLDYLLRDLAAAAGVAVGFDPRQFPAGLPHLNVDLVGVPLRDAVRTLVDLAGFDGCTAEQPRGLWFYRGPQPYPSGELLWDQAVVRAYSLAQFLPKVAPLTGEAIVHLIKRRVYPESWHDPATLCFYHAPTNKLLVVHGPAAHQKIAAILYDLWERGEAALGPADE